MLCLFPCMYFAAYQDVSIGSEATEEQILVSLCRVFLVNWREQNQESVYLPVLGQAAQSGELPVLSWDHPYI